MRGPPSLSSPREARPAAGQPVSDDGTPSPGNEATELKTARGPDSRRPTPRTAARIPRTVDHTIRRSGMVARRGRDDAEPGIRRRPHRRRSGRPGRCEAGVGPAEGGPGAKAGAAFRVSSRTFPHIGGSHRATPPPIRNEQHVSARVPDASCRSPDSPDRRSRRRCSRLGRPGGARPARLLPHDRGTGRPASRVAGMPAGPAR